MLFKGITKYILLIAILSIGCNIYLLMNKPEPLVNTITEIKYKTKVVTQIKTVVETQSVYVLTTNLTIEERAEGFNRLISANLEIDTNPVNIIQDVYGKIFISKEITGNAKLDVLEWIITIDLKPKELYHKSTLPLDIGYIINSNLVSDAGIVFDIPFADSLDVMLGIREFNIGRKFPLTQSTSIRAGLTKEYNAGAGVFIGVRTKLF